MVQASRRKFHYIYKITRVDTSKYYIGMHSTDNLEDGYFGSGKLITASVKKHGREKHIKEILEFCESRESLKKREKELVTKDLLEDKMCLNLALGGGGGWDVLNANSDLQRIKGAKGNKVMMHRRIAMPEWQQAINQKVGIAHISQYLGGRKAKGCFGDAEIRKKCVEASCSAEAIEKRKRTYEERQHQQGNKNSQFGKRWIFNSDLKECKAISGSDPIPLGWQKGRKMKF